MAGGRSLRNNKSELFEQDIVLKDGIELVLGKGPVDLLKLVNSIEEDDFDVKDVDEQVQGFSQVYDDSDFRLVLLRQNKKTPPTRAYVGLLSLYDLLNKESKKLALNKYSVSVVVVIVKCIFFLSGSDGIFISGPLNLDSFLIEMSV